MPTANFSAGTGTLPLVFSVNPVYPVKITLYSGFVKVLTEGGEDYVSQKGAGYALHTLRFDGMPSRDYDGGYDYAARTQAAGMQSLVNWFYNVAPASVFTYQDPFGGSHQVGFADNKLEFALGDHGLYDGQITLKETLG